MSISLYPVITIDGPSGSGKGTIGRLLAQELGWHLLESGLIYRLLAFTAIQQGIAMSDQERLAQLATQITLGPALCNEACGDTANTQAQTLSTAIRTESCAAHASQFSVYPKVRQALLAQQRCFRRAPGLVAEGRDMGSVVFPDAILKIFLQASITERANRRYRQLKRHGINANLKELYSLLEQRDHCDQHRKIAALKPATDAWIIDTTDLTIEQVLAAIKQRRSVGAA